MFKQIIKEELKVPAHTDYLANLRDFVMRIGKKYAFPDKVVNAFKLAVDEDSTNIMRQVELSRHLAAQRSVFGKQQNEAGAAKAKAEAVAVWTRLETEGRLTERPRLRLEAEQARN